jgi:hypothetical protein
MNFKFIKIMAKKVVNLFKKIGRAYMDSMILYYRPMLDAKINPFI